MGHLSDKVGRRRVTAIGCWVMVIYPFVYFRMLDTAALPLSSLAILISLPLHDLQYRPQAAFVWRAFLDHCATADHRLATSWHRSLPGARSDHRGAAAAAVRNIDVDCGVHVDLWLISLVCVYALHDRAGSRDQE